MTEPSDPARLALAADTPPALRDLFRAAEADVPADADLARLAARLGPAFSSASAGGALQGGRAWRWWAIGGGLLGALGVAVGVATRAPGPSPHVEPKGGAVPPGAEVAAPVAIPSQLAPTEALPQQAPSPAAADASNEAVNAPARSAVAPAEPLSEAALLEQARRALAGDPQRALRLTRRHEQRFPNGVLRQEREVIAIAALRRLGRAPEASQRATTFEKQFPDSAHRRAVEKNPAK